MFPNQVNFHLSTSRFTWPFKQNVQTHLMYRYGTDEAKNDNIMPTAANVPPINVTVRYEYLTDRILERGPTKPMEFNYIY